MGVLGNLIKFRIYLDNLVSFRSKSPSAPDQKSKKPAITRRFDISLRGSFPEKLPLDASKELYSKIIKKQLVVRGGLEPPTYGL